MYIHTYFIDTPFDRAFQSQQTNYYIILDINKKDPKLIYCNDLQFKIQLFDVKNIIKKCPLKTINFFHDFLNILITHLNAKTKSSFKTFSVTM